jgi:ClpP class serine protease
MTTNRSIDLQIFTQKWMIDHNWGLSQLLKYHEDIAFAAEHGLAALKYSEARELAAPKVFVGDMLQTGSMVDFKGTGGIALLTLEGVMRVEDGLCSYGVDTLVNDLNAAYNHPGISGVVLKVNSGGGSTIAAGLLRSALTNPPKPVVGLIYMAASGALYGTLPLKNLIAVDPLSLVGSIGVVYQINKKLAAWYTENVDDIYATKSTKKNEGWNAYLKGDRSIFERDADHMADIFGAAVNESRNLTEAQSRVALTGELFTAQEAKKLNLISGFGNLNDAINLVSKLADQQQQEQHNIDDMALNAKFIAQLARFIPGLSLKEGASMEEAEQALAAVPDGASVTELQSTVAQLSNDLVAANETIGAQATAIEGLTTSLSQLEQTVAGMATTMEGFATTAQLEEVQAGLATAEEAAVKVISKGTATPKANTNGNPIGSIDKFQAQLEVADVEGDSKY